VSIHRRNNIKWSCILQKCCDVIREKKRKEVKWLLPPSSPPSFLIYERVEVDLRGSQQRRTRQHNNNARNKRKRLGGGKTHFPRTVSHLSPLSLHLSKTFSSSSSSIHSCRWWWFPLPFDGWWWWMVPLWKKKRTKRDKTEKKEERKSETADTPEELQLFSLHLCGEHPCVCSPGRRDHQLNSPEFASSSSTYPSHFH